MHRSLISTLLIALPLLAAGCDGEATTEPTDEPMDLTDEERADALWTAIDGYDSWDQPANWQGIQFQSEGSPHGPYVQIWMNDAASASIDSGTFDNGSILVKRVYDTSDPSTIGATTYAMQKVEGYGSTDWYWAAFTDDQGTAEPFGDVDMCSGCHSTGSDYSRVVTDLPGTPAM